MLIEDIELSKLTKQQLLIKCNELEIKKCKSKNKMEILHNENRLEYNKDGIPLRDIWTDINNIQSGEKIDLCYTKTC